MADTSIINQTAKSSRVNTEVPTQTVLNLNHGSLIVPINHNKCNIKTELEVIHVYISCRQVKKNRCFIIDLLVAAHRKTDSDVPNKELRQPSPGFPLKTLEELKSLEDEDKEDTRKLLVRLFYILK